VDGEDDLVQINLSYQPSTLDVGYAELKSPSGGQHSIRVWKDSTKGPGNMIIGGSDEKEVWSIGSMPSPLWVEGYLAVLTQSQLWLSFTPDQQSYPGGGENNTDPINFTVFDVDLLVNNTSSEEDDYVAKEKSSGVRSTPINTPAGATDNHIPMKIQLTGPSGFSCKVKLSDSGGGDVTIKKTDGSLYPTEGETVTVGTDLEVQIFGTSPSSDLDDVIITAKTDANNTRTALNILNLLSLFIIFFKMTAGCPSFRNRGWR